MTMFCPVVSPQTAPLMDAPGCRLETGVTTSSTEKKTKSKATLLREQKPSAKDLVPETFYFKHLVKDRTTICMNVCVIHIYAMLFLELLTIQSAEENNFVIKYSPAVWKNNVNVWLGMYYDTNSKCHVTRPGDC